MGSSNFHPITLLSLQVLGIKHLSVRLYFYDMLFYLVRIQKMKHIRKIRRYGSNEFVVTLTFYL
jgi:predicted AlkP superfamily pyrophosphatase or phosphodiesterase